MSPRLGPALATFGAWLDYLSESHELPAVACAVVAGTDTVWQHVAGVVNLETRTPFTAGTLFRIASVSKLFTATVVLQLRDRGALDLDAPVVEYLPWFAPSPNSSSRPITVRHLLTHTSGVRREAAASYWNDYGEFPEVVALRAGVSEWPALLPPDTCFKYSNLGAALAGEVASAVSGTPYAELVSASLLEPLELHDTYPVPPAERRAELAMGYYRRSFATPRRATPFLDCRALVPAANFASTLADLCRFLGFHFAAPGDELLSRETRAEMQRVHWLNPDWLSGRGLGFGSRRLGDVTVVGHEGWVMGCRTYVGYAPAEGFGVVLHMNADDVPPSEIYERAVSIVTPIVREERQLQEEAMGTVPLPERFIGRFRSSWHDVVVAGAPGGLRCTYLNEPAPFSAYVTLVPTGDARFRIESASGGFPIGEDAVFEDERAGRFMRLRLGDTYLERL